MRTSNFALASFLLAIVGAFTVVGTVAAVVLGLLGAAAILRDRERLGGLGFAVTGVVLGAAFTALTLFSLSQIEFFGAALRRGQMVGQLDKKVDPNKDVEIDESGFRITKPMTWWRANKDFSFLAAQPLLRDDAQLLLVQPDTGAFVDVQVEPAADVGPIDDYVLNRIKPDSVHDNEGAKPHEGDAENLARIEERKLPFQPRSARRGRRSGGPRADAEDQARQQGVDHAGPHLPNRRANCSSSAASWRRGRMNTCRALRTGCSRPWTRSR